MIMHGNQRVEVNIPDNDILQAAIKMIRTKYDLHGRYLVTGFICQDGDERHGSISTKQVREATPDDLSALVAIDVINKVIENK